MIQVEGKDARNNKSSHEINNGVPQGVGLKENQLEQQTRSNGESKETHDRGESSNQEEWQQPLMPQKSGELMQQLPRHSEDQECSIQEDVVVRAIQGELDKHLICKLSEEIGVRMDKNSDMQVDQEQSCQPENNTKKQIRKYKRGNKAIGSVGSAIRQPLKELCKNIIQETPPQKKKF